MKHSRHTPRIRYCPRGCDRDTRLQASTADGITNSHFPNPNATIQHP